MNVLWSGVDTLEASFRGNLAPELPEHLEELKAFAQLAEHPVTAYLGDYPFSVSGSGLKPWRWLLKGDDFHLRLSPSRHIPTASVRLLSVALAAYGHLDLYRLAHDVAGLVGRLHEAGASRLDIFADLQGFEPTVEDMAGIVCPASYRAVHLSGSVPQTFQYGKGALVLRVYNKTAELASSHKSWLREVWATCEGYDPQRDVWRVEAQLRREALESLGCHNTADAFAMLPDLFASALAWCELRVPDGVNPSRWQRSPIWDELCAQSFGGVALPRIVKHSSLAAMDRVVPQALGLLISGSAHLGISDPDEAFSLLALRSREYLASRGQDFGDRVRMREVEIRGTST